MMQKPDMSITSPACRPAISIEQKTTSKNPRSTVGTVTEIYDYLRLLFARAGTPYSPATGEPITAQQVQDMVDRVMAMEEGTRGYLLAPIVRDRKGEYRKEMLELRKQGFQRVKVDGEFHDLDDAAHAGQEVPARHRRGRRPDRRARGAGDAPGRLASAPRSIWRTASPSWRPRRRTATPSGAPRLLREVRLSRQSGFTIPEIEPRLFSFNAPFGACPKCDGLGVELFFDERLVVPDVTLSLAKGAHGAMGQDEVAVFPSDHRCHRGKQFGFDKQAAPWKDLPADVQTGLPARIGQARRSSSATTKAAGSTKSRASSKASSPTWNAATGKPTAPGSVRSSSGIRTTAPASPAAGTACDPKRLAVKIGPTQGQGRRSPSRRCRSSPCRSGKPLDWVQRPCRANRYPSRTRKSPAAILKEIRERLGFLNNVGLDYLTLSRASGTLSGVAKASGSGWPRRSAPA